MTDHESASHQQQRLESQRLIGQLKSGELSRRTFMVRAAALGFSGAAINAFLIACGGAPATTAPTATTARTTTTTTAAAAPAAVTRTAAPGATATRPGGTATRTPGTATRTPTRTGGAAGTPGAAAGIRTAQGTQLGGEIPAGARLADRQELRYPFVEITNADPGKATAVLEVTFILQCWDSLVSSNQEGDPRPAHAERFEVSPDGLTYTFTLRNGLRFSDGSPLTAADYEWTWKRNLDPETASDYAQALYPIKGAEAFNTGATTDRNSVQVRATNPTTLVVQLEEPAPYFLALVSTWSYVPLKRAAIEQFKEKWVEAGNMVTAGKYKLQTWEHDVRMVLVRDDNYYGEKPSLTQITFPIYKDPAASELPAYERNEIDVVTTLAPDDLQRVRNDARFRQEFYLLPESATGFLCCDTSNQRSPASRKEFRQAVYFAVNRERLGNDVLRGQYIPTATLAPPGILGHIEQPPLQGNTQRGDRDRARALLQQANYRNTEEIALTYNTNASLARNTAESVQQDLRDVGINVRLDPLERAAFNQWRSARKDQPFDIYVGGWFSDYEDPNNWYNFFFGNPDQEFWNTHYSRLPTTRPFLDLIRSGNQARNRAERERIYQQAERQLLEDLPLIPLYNFAAVRIVKPYVKGLVFTNLAQDLFGNVRVLAR